MTYHTTGIILKRETWRDTARLYTIYTREHGKLLAAGRGTRKPLSKLAAHLEPYSQVELLLARGRRVETICGAIMKRQPEPLVADEHRHAAAAFFAEAVDHFVKPSEHDDRLWELFDTYLADLAVVPEEEIFAHLAAFTWRFMDALGYRPRLDGCASCKRDPVKTLRVHGAGLAFTGALFLPVKGVLLCSDCRFDERQLIGAEPIDSKILAYISEILDGGNRDLTPVSTGALRVGLAFLEAHLDRSLASLPIIREALISQAGTAKVMTYADHSR